MEAIFHFTATFIAAMLDFVSLAMIVRMFFSLLYGGEENRFSLFLTCITEPFITPIRFLMVKFNILQNSPIDWSFTVSYLIIVLLRTVLPVI